MEKRLLKNELIKNPGNNLIIILFISISFAVIMSVTFTFWNLFNSISSLYDIANPPHFLQLHKGDLNIEEIDNFNKGVDYLDQSQIITMINAFGKDFKVIPKDKERREFNLENFSLDIFLVTQNEKFDYLLDANKNIINLKKGEIALPRVLLETYDIRPGDNIIYKSPYEDITFTVTDLMYDAQMNTRMAGSVRFLIDESDFENIIIQNPEVEYMIEARLLDSSFANEYQNIYEQAGLANNGQAITYPLIITISAFTDILNSLMFLVAGFVFIFISYMTLKYVLQIEIEEDRLVIGNMKAMGIPYKKIRSLYLKKFSILTVFGIVMGSFLSTFLTSFLNRRTERIFGKASVGFMNYILGLSVAILMYVLIRLFIKYILRKIKYFTVIDILVENKSFEKDSKNKKIKRLAKLPSELAIGLQNARNGYGIIIFLVFATSLIIIFSSRVTRVFKADEFINFMGREKHTAYLELEPIENHDKIVDEVKNILADYKGNIEFKENSVYRQKINFSKHPEKSTYLYLEQGKGVGNNLNFLYGVPPKEGEKEIAISYLLANELDLELNDKITISNGDFTNDFWIRGIYQDISSGGKTGKTSYLFKGSDLQKTIFYLDSANIDQVKELETKLRSSSIINNNYKLYIGDEFTKQIIEPVVNGLKNVALIISSIALTITFIIVMLFEKLRLIKYSEYFISKKQLGVGQKKIIKEEVFAVIIAGIKGLVLSILVLEIFSSRILTVFLQVLNLGIARINMQASLDDLFYTFIIFSTIILATFLSCSQIKILSIRGDIND